MKGIRKLSKNPAGQTIKNFLAATNAIAEQQRQRGEKHEYLSVANAAETYKKLIKTAIALFNPAHEKHNSVFNAIQNELGHNSDTIELMRGIGEEYSNKVMSMAQIFAKNGISNEAAIEGAYNSLAGNPVYDHFVNLGLLAGQLYEKQALVSTWMESGDAFSVPQEDGGTGTDKSRFRAPYEQVFGSAKIRQGDINPRNHMQDDNNRIDVSLLSEFKNAVTLDAILTISQDKRNQVIGYQNSIAPALAGFLIQNRLFSASEKQVMKLAELMFAFGSDAAGNYVPGVGGSYGLLSSAIHLSKSDYDSANPSVATYSDWTSNPTKLIQKITNYNYALQANAHGPLLGSIDPSLMYKDIVRLLSLAAKQNVDFTAKEWVIFVPTSWYEIAVQYPGTQSGGTGQGTFNKQLNEMVTSATSGVINSVRIVPSGLMNWGADNGFGSTNQYNYMVAAAMGCEQESKPVIMPGRTATPVMISEQVTSVLMKFRVNYIFGGPMVMHTGGAFVMEFSK